ncbi:MAG: cation-transporting P-type ATPase, partial [Verrucomicrobiales bacterium]|nr:cation-transporting P-type ATPase [Verrucomicrobiales bacterium]
MIEIPERPWSSDSRGIQGLLDVACERGLSEEEAGRRLEQFGPNRLKEFARRSTWRILVDQLRSLIVALLGVAAIISFAVGQGVEAGAIVIVILINTAIGFFTELKALRSMEALRRLGGSKAIVRRDGKVGEIDADHLVPGDIVILDAGDAMTADLRVLQSSKLQANESALTGESIPVGKSAGVIGGETLLADRTNMLFKGTFLTRGSGEAVVVGTGMRSELGEISALVEKAAQEEDSPLERRLDRLGKKLIGVTLAITALVAVI